jgi:hypothetical protein
VVLAIPDMDTLSLVVVSSPSPSHPSTFLVEQCLLSAIAALCLPTNLPLFVVLDGYKVHPKARTKMGRITSNMEANYDTYHQRLPDALNNIGFASSHTRIERLGSHHGFALAVKAGLELCKTKHVLVLQHDRIFRKRFDGLQFLLSWLSEDPRAIDIRYLGFPTQSNNSHDIEVASHFLLPCLHDPDVRIELRDPTSLSPLALQPALHWWDSQHLAVREKYLEIYSPVVNEELVDLMGGKWRVNRGLLRSGDFIEDRWGQWMRLTFREAKQQGLDDGAVKKIFRFFSSYLIFVDPESLGMKEDAWSVDLRAEGSQEQEREELEREEEEGQSNEKNNGPSPISLPLDQKKFNGSVGAGVSQLGGTRAVSFVSHLRGRTLDLTRREEYISAAKVKGDVKRADREKRDKERAGT